MQRMSDEYTVFPRSKYQSDGWEPFLPGHSLAETSFEHLALEFQARKRKLDKVRTSQASSNDAQRPAVSRSADNSQQVASGFVLNLPNNRSDAAARLRLVDEDLHEYSTLPGYKPSVEQIKRFLYVEARRLSCAFPGWEFGGASFASVKSERRKKFSATTDTFLAAEIQENEEDTYREALQRFADLHRLPKIVEAVLNLSGSGAANLITDVRSDAYAQALAIFKSGLCHNLGISKSDVSILGVKNTTVGKLAESVEIDFQIFTYREDLCHDLSQAICTSVTNGTLASELNNIGLTVYVTLRAGPILFQYPHENDFTQSLFGAAAAVLLRNRILKFKSAAFGTKTQAPRKHSVSATSDSLDFLATTEDDDNGIENQPIEAPKTQLTKEEISQNEIHFETVQSTKTDSNHNLAGAVRKKFLLGDKDTMQMSTGIPQSRMKKSHGFELHKRPATVCAMSRAETSPEVQDHLSRCKKRQIDAMDKWSLAIPTAVEEKESYDEEGQRQEQFTGNEVHVSKLASYFAKASSMKKSPSTGCPTTKVVEARREWDHEMTQIREQFQKSQEFLDKTLENSRKHAEKIHKNHVENNRKTKKRLAAAHANKPVIHPKQEVHDSVPNEHFKEAQSAGFKKQRDECSKPQLREEFSKPPRISLPLFPTKPSDNTIPSVKPPNVQSAYNLLMEEDESDEEDVAPVQQDDRQRSSSPETRNFSSQDISIGGESVKIPRGRHSRSQSRSALLAEEQHVPSHKFSQVLPLDMGRAERIGLSILAQSHVDHVLKDDRLLNAVDYSKEALARNLKAEKQFQPVARRIERKVQLTYKRGDVLTCMVCQDRRKISLSNAIPALIEMLNPKGILGLEEIDCPYCLGLNSKYRFEPIAYNKVITDELWEAPKYSPPLGPNQLILQVHAADGKRHDHSMNSIVSIWLSPTFGNFIAISSQGSIVEAEVSTGKIIRRFHTPKTVDVNCSCATKSFLFVGVGSSIHEIAIASGEFTRSLKGMRGLIISCSTSSDGKMLAAGSSDCTTFIWELTTGKVCRHVIDFSFSLPDQIKHLSDGFGARSQTFTFRHHAGPVSCCSMRRDAVITGSWDGSICVASLSSYREKWNEENAVAILEKQTKKLSREAKIVAVDLAERQHERKKSVRIFRQHAENLESLKNTLELMKATLASKKVRLQQMNCRKFLCCSERTGRVTCMSMQYLKKIGYLLFAGYSDGKIRQWDIKTETAVRVFATGRDHDVACMCFGGERMFTGGERGSIKVWNLSNLAQNTTTTIHKNEFDIFGHDHGVVSMKVCGNILLSAADDETVRVWNLLACEFEVNSTDPNIKDTEVSGDVTSREAPLTSRSARSTLSTGSSLSSFFGGNIQNDFAGKVINISIFEEPVDFKLDHEENSADEDNATDLNPSPKEISESLSSERDSDSAEDRAEPTYLHESTTMEPLSETVYIDLLDMANSLPALNSSLKESIETANKWSRRLVLAKSDANKK